MSIVRSEDNGLATIDRGRTELTTSDGEVMDLRPQATALEAMEQNIGDVKGNA